MLAEMMQEQDEPILKTLLDIKGKLSSQLDEQILNK